MADEDDRNGDHGHRRAAGGVGVALLAYLGTWGYGLVAAGGLALVSDGGSLGGALRLAGQLVTMSFLTDLNVPSSVGTVGSDIGVVPVAVAVLALVLILVMSWRWTPATGLRAAAGSAAVTALVFAAVSQVVAGTVQLEDGTATSMGGFAMTMGAVAVASFVGSAFSELRRVGWLPSSVVMHLTAAIVFVGVFTALTLVGVAGHLAVEGEWRVFGLAPVGAGNVAVYALTAATFGPISYDDDLVVLDVIGVGSGRSTVWLFSDVVPGWAALLLLLASLIAIFLAAVSLGLLYRDRPHARGDWGAACGVFALLGLALVLGGHMSSTPRFEAFDADSGVLIEAGPAVPVILVLAVWGIGLEALRRHVAPLVVSMAPRGAVEVLRRRTSPIVADDPAVRPPGIGPAGDDERA